MAAILIGMDALLCLLILLASLDYLRAVQFADQPMVCAAFYIVAIGAFGLLVSIWSGFIPNPWSVLLHLGITLYAIHHHRDIFGCCWEWSGCERRKAGH